MVNGLREQIHVNSTLPSPRSAFSPNNNSAPAGMGQLNSPLDTARLSQRVAESKKISRSLQDAFDGLDSGTGVSPIDFGSLNNISEQHLIPGLVQDLQNLRTKLDSSVKKSERLSSRLDQKRKRTTSEISTQTDLSVIA